MKINSIYNFIIFSLLINIQSLSAQNKYIFSIKDYSYSLNNSIKSQKSKNNFKFNTQNNFPTNFCYEHIKNHNKILKDCERIKLVKNNIHFADGSLVRNIQPYIPVNFFLNNNEIRFLVDWKSSLDGGVSEGIGQQNPSFQFDYAITNRSLLSAYFSEADDLLYNLIEGEEIPYHWQNLAFSYQRQLLKTMEEELAISLFSSIEYWKNSSGSTNHKSIYSNSPSGKDTFKNIIGSLSLPVSKKLTNKLQITVVPGVAFLPSELGSRSNTENSYGKNIFLGQGFIFNISEHLNFSGSYTHLFGPGSNFFDRNLNYSRKPIYSFGLNWEVNPRIQLGAKITNAFGSTPASGLLTIPSDDLALYSFNFSYTPNREDTELKPIEKKDILKSFGGITVNNALIPKSGSSQINLNYDSSGNLFGFYGYSLSNIFQLELLNIGSFDMLNLGRDKNSNLYSTYINENNLNFRLGGKLSIYSPQKENLLWIALRSSVGRNNETNQGYLFSELINTFKVNNWLTFNISPKYFFSGVESFGGFGLSSHINLLDNFLLIPEINTSIKNDPDLNSTIALRYSFSPKKSLDIYYSNAVGIQDIGQLLKDKKYRLGIKLNLIL